MNCSRFRFLIQQWFDSPLSSQDERMVMAHLETCDSCARFQHQLDQVIQGTPDVPLPDECLPSNLEALAKRIMVEIPQEKPGFLSMLKGLLPFGKGQPKKDKKAQPQPQGLDDESGESGGGFPHVRRKQLQDAPAPGTSNDGVPNLARGKRQNIAMPVDEDLLATSTRLKSLQKLNPVDQDPQAMTSSRLGGRFGVNIPEREQGDVGGGVNLAESIRRKVAESGTEPGFAEPGFAEAAFGQEAGYGAEQGFAGGPGGGSFGGAPQFGEQSGFGSAPGQGGGFGAQPLGAQSGTQPAFGGPPTPQGGMVGGWGQAQNTPAPQPAGWGDPPTPGNGGDSDWKPTPPGSDWGAPKAQSGGWAGQPGQPVTGQQQSDRGSQSQSGDTWGAQRQSGEWGATAAAGGGNDSWGAPPTPATAGNDSWGSPAKPAAAANDGWGAPPTPANDGGWGGSAGGGNSWGGPAPTAPAAPAASAAQGGGWGQPAPPAQGGGWGAPPTPAASNNDWGAPAAPAAAGNDGWGAPKPAAQANDGWGTPKPTAPANDGWGQPPAPAGDGWGAPATPAANTPPTTSGGWGQAPDGGWGQPQAAQNQPDGNWGAPPKVEASGSNPAWGNPTAGNDGWGTSASSSKQDAWGQPAPAAPAANSGWGQPAPAAAPTNDGWGTPAAAPQAPVSGGWGTPAPAAPAAGGWGAPPTPAANDGWGTQPQAAQGNPFITASPAPASPRTTQPAADADAWSEEGEQIQTGMWQAFTLDEPALGTPKNQTGSGSRPTMPPGPGATDASRWDTPIQQRPPEPENDQNRWDVPISERMKQQQAAPTPAPAAATPAADQWGAPVPQPASAQPQMEAPSAPGQQPNSIMDRLTSLLGDDLSAMAGGPGQPPMATAPMAAPPPPAPPQMMPPAAPTTPQAPAADASQFDIPIQERLKQQAGQPAPEPVAARTGGLFNVDDATIDKVFSNIGATDKQPAATLASPAANMAATPVPPVMPGGTAVPPPVPPMQARGPVPPAAPPAVPGAPRISAVPPRNPAGASLPPNAPAPAAPLAPAAPAATPPVPGPQSGSKGLFNVDDAAMDRIFSQNLGVPESGNPPAAAATASIQQSPPPVPPRAAVPPPAAPPQVPAAPQGGGWGPPVPPVPAQPAYSAPAAPAAPAAPMATPPAMPPQAGSKGLFNVDDAAMDKIFNDLGVKEKAAAAAAAAAAGGAGGAGAPKINVREAVNQIRNLADIPAPKVEGVGRLSRIEEQSEPAPAGKINAIGKFLLDQSDLQKLGNLASADLSDGKVRVLTHEASEEISKLLEHIATQAGVVGSVIVGHDGILIANSLPKELDPETIGILSLGIYVNTTSIAKKMGHSHLHQLVSKTQYGYLVVADFGGGILVTVSNGQDTEKLIPLMRSITQLVAQN